MLTVRAERVAGNGDWQRLASERTHGQFSRQLVLGDNLDLTRIEAGYDNGVLRLVVPVAEKAKPRKIEIAGARADGRDAGHRGLTGLRARPTRSAGPERSRALGQRTRSRRISFSELSICLT